MPFGASRDGRGQFLQRWLYSLIKDVGWCQFGQPDEVPQITNGASCEQGQTSRPDWRTACCYVGNGHRRQGVAAAALAGATPST